jgi:hypothetical protein
MSSSPSPARRDSGIGAEAPLLQTPGPSTLQPTTPVPPRKVRREAEMVEWLQGGKEVEVVSVVLGTGTARRQLRLTPERKARYEGRADCHTSIEAGRLLKK